MNEDMSNLMNQIEQMMKSNKIPENIKEIMGQFSNTTAKSNSQNSENGKTTNISNSDINSDSSQTSNPEFDVATFMKMKKVIDSINMNKDDPRANLLLSLKPYLKDSRKEKVDQYIQIFKIGKVFEILNPSGGESSK